jgi:hypothetical protein
MKREAGVRVSCSKHGNDVSFPEDTVTSEGGPSLEVVEKLLEIRINRIVLMLLFIVLLNDLWVSRQSEAKGYFRLFLFASFFT